MGWTRGWKEAARGGNEEGTGAAKRIGRRMARGACARRPRGRRPAREGQPLERAGGLVPVGYARERARRCRSRQCSPRRRRDCPRTRRVSRRTRAAHTSQEPATVAAPRRARLVPDHLGTMPARRTTCAICCGAPCRAKRGWVRRRQQRLVRRRRVSRSRSRSKITGTMPRALLREANERINRLPRTELPPTLREVLDLQVGRLLEALRDAEPVVAAMIGARAVQGLDLDGAREAIAREHRFAGWAAAMARGRPRDRPVFRGGGGHDRPRRRRGSPAAARRPPGAGAGALELSTPARCSSTWPRTASRTPASSDRRQRGGCCALLDAGAEVDATC